MKIEVYFFLGPIPSSLFVSPEGPVAQPAAGGPYQTLRKLEERRTRHQKPQLVPGHRLDHGLPEKGKKQELVLVSTVHVQISCFFRRPKSVNTFEHDFHIS